MTKITRRKLLGASAGFVGLTACKAKSGDNDKADLNETDIALYPGKVSFGHGVASGDPLHDRVILWTRVTPEDEASEPRFMVQYRLYADAERAAPVLSGAVDVSAASDYTIKVDADGLEPDTEYFYEFSVYNGVEWTVSPLGRTKTTAQSGDAPVKFAVISCSNYPFGFFNVYGDIAKRDNLDAVIHLGDYIYEYGLDGYGASTGKDIDRNHEPPLEIVSLGDYRIRHAQYKTDPQLQAAHAVAPWLCTWDDHESTNDSYRNGAQNHNPEEMEGNWSDRKQAAVQAYLEWMPVRDPVPGRLKESIYRTFEFGDVASVMCLESRLTGRSDEISWFAELGGLEPSAIPLAAAGTMLKVEDDARTMLGAEQENWLADELKTSVKSGKAWQILANQVIMARVRPPNFEQTLTEDQKTAITNGLVQQLVPFSQLGLPWNLDAWDGFPAARDRLYNAAKQAEASLVTLTGDTHTAWANRLLDTDGQQRGVEFACTSVTSPGFGTYMPGVENLGEMFVDINSELEWHDPHGNGWTELTLESDKVTARFYKISTVLEANYTSEKAETFVAAKDEALNVTGPVRV